MKNKKRFHKGSRMVALAFALALVLAMMVGCRDSGGDWELNDQPKDASDFTRKMNEGFGADFLDFEDVRDYDFATRWKLGDAPEVLEIRDADGIVIWSQAAYAFVEDNQAPDTVNPSLWRNTQLHHYYGLFRVAEEGGIYQVRGYDLTNITFIAGDTGWIIYDPLMSVECARAAWELFNANETIQQTYGGIYDIRDEDSAQGFMPIAAVIYSHPHGDHFGGVRGIFSDEANTDIYAYIEKYGIHVIAPDGFEEHAVSENVYSGLAMLRRAEYQYGSTLEAGIRGTLAMGIGMGQSVGTASYISPNFLIMENTEAHVIDGVEMEFHLTYGTEAPVEIHTWFPKWKALWIAENCTGTLHNLYTLRGAQVRDGNAWAYYVMEALAKYGRYAEVIFMSHTWPRWGNEEIQDYMTNNAAMYKFINDQTLYYINLGYTTNEISRMITLPDHLERAWYTRQYYGTVAHNSKAVYQRYMGWYDANPVNLNPLDTFENAVKLVEYMGGDTESILDAALRDFERGEYQWVAQVTNALIFADPGMKDANTRSAQLLCADALEQLGYQTESGTWRNAYLTAAMELRAQGRIPAAKGVTATQDMMNVMPPNLLFDYMGIRLDTMEAQRLNDGKDIIINFNFADGEDYLVTIRAGVLLYQRGDDVLLPASAVDLTLGMPGQALALLVDPGDPDLARWSGAIDAGIISAEGNLDLIVELRALMRFDMTPDFNIVLP